ncbi:MAG: DUF938 domain-containing protein [Burkholderiales bacterium]
MAGLVAPAAERNKAPILEVLKDVLPSRGVALEIASGSGQHVLHFARAFPDLMWIPSDASVEARQSIRAWLATEPLPNVQPPVELDVRSIPWAVPAGIDAIVCINLIHIAPWPVTPALFQGARQTLPPGGVLYLYGPYKQHGRHTAPSNDAFDRSLRAQNAEWGVRDLDDVVRTAGDAGFDLVETREMPANNLSVVFRRYQSNL